MSTEDTAVADIVVETVARCRRRMQLVSAVRRGAVTMPIAIIGVELIALGMFPAPAQFVMLTFGAVALASIGAAIPSILRAPSMRAAAAAIDARLQLQDRTVTALQLIGASDDPMAQSWSFATRERGCQRCRRVVSSRSRRPCTSARCSWPRVAVTIVFLAIAGAPAGSWLAARVGSNGTAGAGAGRSGRSAKPGSNAQIVEGVAPSASLAQPRASAPTSASRDEHAGRPRERAKRRRNSSAWPRRE